MNSIPTALSTLILFYLTFLRKCKAQGFDAGDADPLKFGLIDPLALEVASTYVFIVPFVIFLVGILVIPAVLVITFLIVVPFLIPDFSPAERAFKGYRIGGNSVGQTILDSATSMFSKSFCLNRIICEINLSDSGPASFQNENDNSTTNGNSSRRKQRKRKVFERRTSCDRYSCKMYETLSSFGRRTMEFLST